RAGGGRGVGGAATAGGRPAGGAFATAPRTRRGESPERVTTSPTATPGRGKERRERGFRRDAGPPGARPAGRGGGLRGAVRPTPRAAAAGDRAATRPAGGGPAGRGPPAAGGPPRGRPPPAPPPRPPPPAPPRPAVLRA